jgi:hypothetical protein
MCVDYYVIYDPLQQVMSDVLTVYRRCDGVYARQETAQFPSLKLGLTLWEGEFEGQHDTWLRWTDEHGGLIPTGKELAEQAHQQAEQAHQRADEVRQRVERLTALLRQAGIDPDQA